jgi:hypothetical protein
MASTKTTVGLTPEARVIIDDLLERLGFKELADVRDIAVAHAIRRGIKVKKVSGITNVWGAAQTSDDLVAILRVVYPEDAEEDVIVLYENLANLGLEDLGTDKNYKRWKDITDLPGLNVDI